jgi:hypothetical protein
MRWIVRIGSTIEWAGTDSNLRLTDYGCWICRAFGSTKRPSPRARWGYPAIDLPSREHVGNTARRRLKSVARVEAPGVPPTQLPIANGSRVRGATPCPRRRVPRDTRHRLGRARHRLSRQAIARQRSAARSQAGEAVAYIGGGSKWSVSRRLICRGALPEGRRTAHFVSRSEAGPRRQTYATASGIYDSSLSTASSTATSREAQVS